MAATKALDAALCVSPVLFWSGSVAGVYAEFDAEGVPTKLASGEDDILLRALRVLWTPHIVV